MPTPALPHLLAVGPAEHGVTGYARELAVAIGGAFGELPNPAPQRTHAHVTDRIYGATLEQAAERIELLGTLTRLTITMHDVPQPSDGASFHLRIAAYRRFIAASRGVVVNSQHEALLLEEHLGQSPADLRVIPLGTRTSRPSEHERAEAPPSHRVLISGFVYPGKGHLEAIHAAAAAGLAVGAPKPSVIAVGAPSAGHEREAQALVEAGAAVGVEVVVTGYLDEHEYRRMLLSDGVPLAAHQHVSASRSMIEWAEIGRRALVADSRYAREMAVLRPGSLALYRPEDLAERLATAWLAPESTWIDASTSLAPTLDEVAADYREWWRALG